MKWHWYEAIGYVGSIFMFMTFFMKTMIPLRITAITANIVMIVYTALAGILPVLILQSCLLPLNILRFIQMRRLIQRVKAAARGDFSIDPLLPFMKPERRKEGDVLFKAGDRGDRVYYIQQGKVQLEEVGVTIDQGAVFGEISLLSPENERTATAVCATDCNLYTVTQEVMMQLFYQRPEFSFFIIRLITRRLLDNLETAHSDATTTTIRRPEAPSKT